MAGTWLLLLLALGCPALPTDLISFPAPPAVTTLPRPAQQGVGGTPFPSLAPPITLLVDGKQQTLVVCLVLDVAPPGLESPIWFSADNGSSLDAFTYGPSPEADGTWTSLAQLSLPSEELAAWENLVCHTGPEAGDRSQRTRPLQLSGEASSARTCLWERLRGLRGQAVRLGALRLLLFKLLLSDVLLTCGRLRAPPSARGDPGSARAPRARGRTAVSRSLRPTPGLAAVPGGPRAQGSPRPPAWRRSPAVRARSPGAQSARRGRFQPTDLGLVLLSRPYSLRKPRSSCV
ncbi:pre T-cell antigen receptor alpha [Ursus americanus]|uniref:pre T-cell antigen receptor alpha n=1 Tax=Ursus arctos TaxID=9644 RepID=UPI001E67AB49|nr:pre T-cell antigen receptor alpha [Ursus arctos]XP_045661016.1 pre T-cell antigen receptor alpha [Ursus americanus]